MTVPPQSVLDGWRLTNQCIWSGSLWSCLWGFRSPLSHCLLSSQCFLLYVFHCDVSQMRQRTPVRTEHISVISVLAKLTLRFRASESDLSTRSPTPVVFPLTIPRRFPCCSFSLFVRLWFHLLFSLSLLHLTPWEGCAL